MKWINHVEAPKYIRPIRTFLFKVASRCNLNCDYCYVYQGPDQSWRERPRFMSARVAQAAARRIDQHVRRHALDEVAVVFHGGEPLLAGVDRLREYVQIVNSTVSCNVAFATQTNATLLDSATISCLADLNIKVGISIDGGLHANDRHRRFRNGKSSYARVRQAISLLESKPEWRTLLGGFLVVVDIRNTPGEVHNALLEIGARSIDLLLPDAHHDSPPFREMSDINADGYGRWLSAFFDAWIGSPEPMEVRLFEEIMTMMFGGESTLEFIGAKSVNLIIVEADGSVEAVDTLKVVGREATDIGLDVFRNCFDEALDHPAVLSRMTGYEGLCQECRECKDLDTCGGGYLPSFWARK